MKTANIFLKPCRRLFYFNDTVANNIGYGKQDANESEIIEAAKLSLAHDFINDLPDKYETIIGENACKLSEGQKQKIAIARALIKKPKILILDGAMSSMDSASEGEMLLNIKQNQKETTLITVSHRLSTVMRSDLVYFLKRPDRLIVGFCEELLQNNKEFHDLFKGQIRDDVYLSNILSAKLSA